MQTEREENGTESGGEHDGACRCVDCDPDTYVDERAEVLAGQRDERW